MEHSIYEFPEVFRAVHMERPEEIAEEAKFLEKVWARHLKRRVGRVLDIASGDSPHGLIFAREGIYVAGVDRSPAMIAKGRADARGLGNLKFYRRRIESFRIPEKLFDAAFFMSETFPVIMTNPDLLTHFESVARLLRQSGLYCIDVDRQDGVRTVRSRTQWHTRIIQVGDTTVEARAYNRPISWHSGMHSYFELECTIRFPDREVLTRDKIPIRYTLPSLLDFAARASGRFELIACYTDLSFTTPIAKCHRRWMGVLRRK